MLIDVVISTKNNLSLKNFSLQYVIRSLLYQRYQDLNIIVADNGSDDDTARALKRTFGQKVGIIDTSHCTGNISASRNAASSCGKSELIFFMDDDMVTGNPEAIGKCIDIGMNVEFACGAIRFWAPLTWPILIRPDDPINKVISTLKHTASEPTSINRLSGKNILDNRSYIANFGVVKRIVFEAIGGFDEEYLGWGFQDTDLMHRLCLEGYRYDLFSIYDIVVYHLAHQVDKGSNYELNRARFLEKQRSDGRIFRTNHFFEIYENDGYSLFSDFSEENIF